MASNRQRRLITKLYIASALLILIGIGVLIGGILGGLSLRNKLERLGRELAVLEHDNIDDWGDIPGRRERELNHQFHVFNITNPREVFYGQQPISQMHGPWTFNEERDTETVEVSRATDVFFNETGELFSYDEAVKFYHTRSPQDMSDEMSETFSVYNPDTFTMQYSHRVEDDWLRAIRSLSGMINYTSTQFRDTLILQYMRKHYFPDHYSSKQVFTDTRLVAFVNHPRVPRATIDSLWSDEIFGFSNFENAKFWGDI